QSLFSAQGFGGLTYALLGVKPPVAHRGGVIGSIPNDGRAFAPSLWAGASRYHSGGIAGLRPGEVPAILQRGEVVLPKALTGSASYGNNTVYNQQSLGDVNIDMAGRVTATNDQAQKFGEDIQKYIEIKLVKESRRGGLLDQYRAK